MWRQSYHHTRNKWFFGGSIIYHRNVLYLKYSTPKFIYTNTYRQETANNKLRAYFMKSTNHVPFSKNRPCPISDLMLFEQRQSFLDLGRKLFCWRQRNKKVQKIRRKEWAYGEEFLVWYKTWIILFNYIRFQ